MKQHENKLRDQGARCMDCGIPVLQQRLSAGQYHPEWNDWFTKTGGTTAWRCSSRPTTSRNSPAASVRPRVRKRAYSHNEKPVTIKLIEQNIIDRAFEKAG